MSRNKFCNKISSEPVGRPINRNKVVWIGTELQPSVSLLQSSSKSFGRLCLALCTAGNDEHAEGWLDRVGGVAWHGISSQPGGPEALGLGRAGRGGGRAGTPHSSQPHQARQEAGGGRGGTAGHIQQQGGFSGSGNYEQIKL
jgi:hypothetical protein